MSFDGQPRPLRRAIESLECRTVPAAVGTANQNFVDQLYRDVLHRAPDEGAAGWVAALDSGEDREDIVDGILDSEEGRLTQVNDLYVRFLGRTADEGGLTFWSEFLRDNDNIELAAHLIGSDEYYQTQGGSTDQGFLNAVYLDVLTRPITVDDIDERDDDFDDGTESRTDIAEDILDSREAEGVRAQLSVSSFLRSDLTADQAEDLVDDDDGDAVFVRSLLSDDAYFNLAQRLTTDDFATVPGDDGDDGDDDFSTQSST